MLTRKKLSLFAFLVAFVPMVAANATVVTYTGNPFTASVGAFGTLPVDPTQGTSVDATFNVDESLAGSGSFTASDITSWSATSVGGFTITSAIPDSDLNASFTYSDNKITLGDWDAFGPSSEQILSYGDGSIHDDATNNAYGQGNIVRNDPGTYSVSVSAVPLPGTVGMFASALLGLIGLAAVRRKSDMVIPA